MLNRLWKRLRALLRRGEMDRELEEELSYYLERETEQNVRGGMTQEEARRAALRAFGGVEQARELCREARGVRMIQDAWQDLRYGVRTLRKQPGFTLVAVMTLALGIGASTTIFSAVNPILFESLPYPQADRLVSVLETFDNGSRNPGTFGMYRGLAERSRSFEALAVFKTWLPAMTGADRPERFQGQRVSAQYFRVL